MPEQNGGKELPGFIIFKMLHLCSANIGNYTLPPNLLKYTDKDPDFLSNSSAKNEFQKS